MKIFGKEVSSFDELVAVVEEEFASDSYWFDEEGNLPCVEDLDILHDLLSDWVSEEGYAEFERILDSAPDDFDGIDFDVGDSMYHMSGGGFSSWSDYFATDSDNF